MALDKVFGIAAHFKFEVASAVLNTQKLSDKVDDLNNSVVNAKDSLGQLALMGFTKLGLLPTSLIGAAAAAFSASQNFKSVQIEWTNLLSMNRENLSGPIDTMNDRLKASRKILAQISSEAVRYGISGPQLEFLTRKMATDLTGKGMAGTNFDFPMEMARNLLKSAPALNIHPELVYGSMQRAFMGMATMGDPLFNRLAMDTNTMKPFQGTGGAKLFNAMEMTERIKTLNKAMGEFTKDNEVLDARLATVGGQMERISEIVKGFDGIFTGIGESFDPVIVEVMTKIGDILNKQGREIGKIVGKSFEMITKDSRELAIALLQVTEAQRAFSVTKGIVAITGIGLALKGLFDIFTKGGKAFIASIRGLSIVGLTMGLVVKPFLAIAAVFLVVSRAMALARLKDIERLPDAIVGISNMLLRFQKVGAALNNIFGPLINWIAKYLSYLFRKSWYLEILTASLEGLLKPIEDVSLLLTQLSADWQGFVAMFAHSLQSIIDGNWGNLGISKLGAVWDEVQADVMGTFNDIMDGTDITAKTTVNIGSVKIENRFKDNLQPDRIAFTMRDQLLDLAENRKQGRSAPFNPAFGR